MKQLVQVFKTGESKLADVPASVAASDCVLVRNTFALVGAGPERATDRLPQQSLVGKASSRRDLWKILDYSTAGTVIEVGEGVAEFAVGHRTDGVVAVELHRVEEHVLVRLVRTRRDAAHRGTRRHVRRREARVIQNEARDGLAGRGGVGVSGVGRFVVTRVGGV